MRATQIPLFTTKEEPSDAQVDSHKILSKAGYIKKQSGGFYVYLPFGHMVHQKIEKIIREEMNFSGAVEVHLPLLTPASFWQQSNRWDAMGPEMMRLKDRHENKFALAPTHEESMTWLASTYLQSYKQLPINLYQIGIKFRDEIRPRYGLIRCREFVMKDAYSFHIDETSLDETYREMRSCYRRIFDRCELKTIPVEADSGNMGGSGSEEFMVASQIGEETLLLCADTENCGYRSNVEKTEVYANQAQEEKSQDLKKIHTPNKTTIEEVSDLLKTNATLFIKTVIYETNCEAIICFLNGDRQASETKIKNLVKGSNFQKAQIETIKTVTGANPGFAGPVSLAKQEGDEVLINNETKKIVILYDRQLKNTKGRVTGANIDDYHLQGVEEGRDFQISKSYDISQARENDICPHCKKEKLSITRGIEVGHIFKLGDKYSKSMGLSVLDKNGKPATPIVGCYGIGVGRTMATVVEQNHDENGILWPKSISPFTVYLVSLAKKEQEKEKADALYMTLVSSDISVFYDDRDERAGIKFHDSELVGFPWILIAGKNYFENQIIEVKNRRTAEKNEMKLESVIAMLGENE